MLYLFEHILNPLLGMSLTAAFVAVVVILLRLVLKKRAPKQVVCLLWLLVFARLLVPVMVESPISLVPPALNEVVSEQMEQAEDPAVPDIDPGDTGDTPVSTPVVPETPAPTPGNVITRPADPVVSQPGAVVPQSPVVSAPAVEDPPVLEAPSEPDVPAEPPVIEDPTVENPAAAPVWMYIVPAVWLAGVAAMLVMGVGSYIKLRRRVYDAIRTEDGVWEHPSLASPFILGLFRPKIYLPMGIGGQPRQFILHHERAHLQRLDHVVKPICWVALAIHWFNPLAWAAFLLMSRDIESACDESVIRKLGSEVKADYSATLLALATDKRFPAPSPLSFGEGDAKARIKNVLNFKKPALWVTIAAVVVVIVAAVCLLTDPVGKFNPDDYATLDCYPGLYFEEVTDEKNGITTTKAYKIVEDEPVLVAGWVDHLASNVNTLIHPDGDEEILLAATWEVTARYEQYLVDEMMAQDERWAADYFAGTDRIFQFFDSEGSELTTIHVGAALTPEGNLLLQYRNDSPQVLSLQTSVPQNADSVKVYVYDRAADGTDRLDILWTGGRKVYSAEPSGSLIFEGDALIAYIWDGETWTAHDSVFEITTADMPVSFDAETQLITVEYDPNAYTNGDPNIAHIDPGIIQRQFPIPEGLGHVVTLALSGEAKIVHRTDGDYDLTYGVLAMPEDGTSDADLVHILDVSAIMKWDSLTEEFEITFTGAKEASAPAYTIIPADAETLADINIASLHMLEDGTVLLRYGEEIVELKDFGYNPMRPDCIMWATDIDSDGVKQLHIIHQFGSGTGVSIDRLTTVTPTEQGLEVSYHDWSGQKLDFETSNAFVYYPENNSIALIYMGEQLWLRLSDYFKDLDWDAYGSEAIVATVAHYSLNDNGTINLAFTPALSDGSPMVHYLPMTANYTLEYKDGALHQVGGCELKADEEGMQVQPFTVSGLEGSLFNGSYQRFELTLDGKTVSFGGSHRADRDILTYYLDWTGDGIADPMILLTPAVTDYGYGFEQSLRLFDGVTLKEQSNIDGMVRAYSHHPYAFTADEDNFYITADGLNVTIPKTDVLAYWANYPALADIDFFDWISIGGVQAEQRITVKDGMICVTNLCMVGRSGQYYGELETYMVLSMDYGYPVPVPVRTAYIFPDGTRVEQSAVSTSLGELFLSALNDDTTFFVPEIARDPTTTLGVLLELLSPDMETTRIAAVDLDLDGVKELLLCLETPSSGYGTLILHYNDADGQVYGYVLWFRTFMEVKTDGTFSYSDSASVGGVARLSFPYGGHVLEKISYSEEDYPDRNIYYYVNKQPATEDEFLDAFAAQQEKPDLTWTEFTPENAEAFIREHFEVADQAPPSSLGFLGSLPSEIVTSDTLPSDPEEYYLAAELPESYVWLYARNYGQDSMLLWNGNFWWPLEGRVAHTGHMNLPKMYLLQENASTTTVAVVSEVDTGTGVGMDELAVYVIGESAVHNSNYTGMQDYVYDWRPIAKEFNENNTLVYDEETNSLTLLWNGTAYCTGTLFNELALGYDLEDGFTGKLLAGGDIIRFTPNGDGTFTATMQTAIAGRPMSIGVTGFTLTWNLTFTGSGFEASDLTITVTNKEQTFLEAAFPEEGIYLFALGNGGAYYYLFEGGQLHKVPGAGIMTDLDVNCRLVDLDGDGRMELAIVGNHYAGSSSFGLLNVFDKGTGGWKHYRLPSYAASDTPDYVSPFGEHDLMDDAAAFTIGSDPAQVTMHLSGFDFLFTVSDEAASRSGDYYVWDGGSSIAWEGDGYYLRLNGNIHRRGGQYGWPSDDCGVTFQFVCRLEYNANGTFEQIPVGILGGTASTLRAAIPEENIYLFRGEGAFGKNYLVTGTRTQELNDSENLGDALIEFDSFDLDGDGEKEIILLTDYYAGSAAFGSLAVLERENGLWTMNRLQTHLTGYELPVKFGDAVFTVGNDPTRVTMHLSGFDFPFTVSDEAASRNGDYYVWENDRSIAWEGDGYYLRLNGSIHRHGGQYGWPSDDCGVMFQFVCRLEYNADGTFKQIPTGIVRSVSAPQKKLAAATRDFYIADSLYSRLIMFGSPEGTWSGSGLSNVPAESPVELIGLTDTAGVLTYVDAGIYGGVMAVDAYGVLWGHGTYADPDRPTEPVRLLDNVAMVSCGQFDTYILRRDGSLWSYDHNNTGLPTMKTMGVNGVTYHKIMDNVISVEAGGFGSGHAILVDHTLWAWDGTRNQFQEVADNVAGYSDGRIIDLDRNLLADDGSVMLTDVTYANYHYAIKTDGTLWALTMPDPGTLWGRGAPLQTPRLITDEVSYIASGEFESILMKWDGSLWQLAIDGTLSGISFTT